VYAAVQVQGWDKPPLMKASRDRVFSQTLCDLTGQHVHIYFHHL